MCVNLDVNSTVAEKESDYVAGLYHDDVSSHVKSL